MAYNGSWHSCHVIRVLWVVLGVEFGDDIQFIIRVHLVQTVKSSNTFIMDVKLFRYKTKLRSNILENLQKKRNIEDYHLISHGICSVIAFSAYVQCTSNMRFYIFSNMCRLWSEIEKL